ncbi:MAG: hypothetical protein F6J96_02020 [Symploca sp. SIO1C2]|nr:hypothetical protein [Symploca sp. SIO1C2]
MASSEEKIQQQQHSFTSLLQELGKASSSEIAATLTRREIVPLEKELDSKTVAILQERIQGAAKRSSKISSDA